MPYACRFSSPGAKRFLLVLAIPLLVPVPVFAAQESFPFLAQVINERVNVRAGQSQNFEKLCQLDKGEEVIVVGRDFSWYKIQLPPRVYVYVSDKYVRLVNSMPAGSAPEGKEEGEITGDRVNVRSSMNVQSTIIGQLEKGQRIRIVEKRPGWYKIAPPAQVFGWVAEGLLTFKSRDITAYRPSVVTVTQLPLKEREEFQVTEAGNEVREANQTEQPPQNFKTVSVKGVLRLVPVRRRQTPGHIFITAAGGDNTGVFYELLIRNKPAYFLQCPRAMLDDFARYTVTIEGTLNAGMESQFPRPVLSVVRVQLVL